MKLFKATLISGIIAVTAVMIIIFIEYNQVAGKWTDAILAICALFGAASGIATVILFLLLLSGLSRNISTLDEHLPL